MDDKDRKSSPRSPTRLDQQRPANPTVPPTPTALLFVSGLTPQIVTETLYCLLVQRRPPADIRAVHIITTRAGEARVRDQLLHPRQGWFPRFCREFGIPRRGIVFGPDNIHVPEGADGAPLDDVRTPEDNLRMADYTLDLVRNLTRDPAVSLHVSVAGGRKTMGLFLGLAYQLFARPQDRLSHVLVSPPDLESHSEFFYPPRKPVVLTVKGKRFSTAHARLELAEIPVLLLREKLLPIGLETLSYTDLIARAQQDLDRLIAPPQVVLCSRTRTLEIAEARILLTPLQFTLYRLLAERRLACRTMGCGGCYVCALEAHDFDKPEVLAQIAKILDTLGARDERARELAGWRDAAYKRFREVRALINGKISKELGSDPWTSRYAIAATGRRPDTRYYLPLSEEQIRLV